jgi:Family of unknown function (DUF5677)
MADKEQLAAARAEYSVRRQEFDAILVLASQCAEGVRDGTARNEAGDIAIVLFDKAVLHAKSLGKVLPSVPGPVSQDHDLASAAVLVRAVAETFLAYWYSCREPKTFEDFDFRDALMTYHRLTRLAATAPLYRFTDGDGEKALRDLLQQARAKLEANGLFKQQSEATRERQLKGMEFSHRQLVDIARSADISAAFWHCTYKYLSQFSHAAPMSVIALSQFDPRQGPGPLAMVLQVASAYLARFTFDMRNNYFTGVKAPSMDVHEVSLLGSAMLLLSADPRRASP